MSLLDQFLDHIVEGAARGEAQKLVATWVAAGYIEPSKETELTDGLIDFVQVVLGMMDKTPKT